MRKNQNGNALWFILLAVFLLAALTVLLTRGSTNTEETGEAERRSLDASKVLKYATGLQVAVENMMLRGCSQNQISFWTDTNNDGAETVADTYYNANAPANRSCHVFDVAGGGMTYTTFANAAIFSAERSAPILGEATKAELNYVMTVPTKEECMQINRNLGVTNPSADAPVCQNWGTAVFTGTYSDGGNASCNSGDSGYASIKDKKAYCIKTSTATYQLGVVVLPR